MSDAEQVLKLLLELVNEHKEVRLERDFGGNTMTIFVPDRYQLTIDDIKLSKKVTGWHAHVGDPTCDFEHFCRQFKKSLEKYQGKRWEETEHDLL